MNTINDYSFELPLFKDGKKVGKKICYLSMTEGSIVEKRVLKRFDNFKKDTDKVRNFLSNTKAIQFDSETKERIPLNKDIDDYYEECQWDKKAK